jgi:hypothetical protein
MSTPEEIIRRRILGEGESANMGQELLERAQSMAPGEARKFLESTGFGVARPPQPGDRAYVKEQTETPANRNNVAFTPPPAPRQIDPTKGVDEQPMRALSSGERTLPGGLKAGDFDEATGKRIGQFGAPAVDRWGNRVPTASDIYGGKSMFSTIREGISNMMLSPPEREALANVRAAQQEPTGSQAVPTQGEEPAADFQLMTENDVTPEMREAQRELFRDGTLAGVSADVDTSQPFTITDPPPGPTYPDVIDSQAALPGAQRLGPDAVDVTDVPYSDFTDPAQIPGNIERSILTPPDLQADGSAEPGQQSAAEPTSKLNRVRIHRGLGAGSRTTDAIVDNPEFAGLEGPPGLSDADLIKYGRLNAMGIRGQDAETLLNLQKRADSEAKRATASLIHARARALFPVETQRGMIYSQVDENGQIGFLETDLKEVVKPRLANVITDDGLKKNIEPTWIWPQVDETGRPTGGLNAVGLGDYIQGNEQTQMEIQRFIDMALEQGATAEEIADELDVRYGFADRDE